MHKLTYVPLFGQREICEFFGFVDLDPSGVFDVSGWGPNLKVNIGLISPDGAVRRGWAGVRLIEKMGRFSAPTWSLA